MKKILLTVLDGLGDRPCAEFDWKTPLQVSNKPNMNFFAKNGITGQMHPISPGIRVGSDTSHLSLLGYNPYKVYTGRGPFEALGLGMTLEPGDIAFRANFATVDENLVVKDRRAGRINDGTSELATALNMELENVKFMVKEGVEHRAALIMRGQRLNPGVTDVDPHEENSKINVSQAKNPDALNTAQLLNQFVIKSYQLLKNHPVNKKRVDEGLLPANILLPRGAGVVPYLDLFGKKYNLKSACVVGIPLIAGICRLAGIVPLHAEGSTGGLSSDFRSKLSKALDSFNNYDFILVNIKAPDIAGHDGNASLKREVIEKIDFALGIVRERFDKDMILAITADHSTPCSVKDHTGDSVPLLIFGHGLRKDAVKEFDEISVMSGGLNINGKDLMPLLLNISDRAEKFGA